MSALSGIASGQPVVTVSPRTFQLFGLVGLYGAAMYVAMIRGNRLPQVPEWIVTLLGLGFAVFFFAFGGFMLTLYAGLHGYDRCPAVSLRNTEAVFVRDETLSDESHLLCRGVKRACCRRAFSTWMQSRSAPSRAAISPSAAQSADS